MAIPNITFPLKSKEDIKKALKALNDEILARESELKILVTMVRQCQSYCKHQNQKTGYNDRDGSWGSPCPTCGYSY